MIKIILILGIIIILLAVGLFITIKISIGIKKQLNSEKNLNKEKSDNIDGLSSTAVKTNEIIQKEKEVDEKINTAKTSQDVVNIHYNIINTNNSILQDNKQ